MSAIVQLVGLDFGTTTSSVVVARAPLVRGSLGQTRLGPLEETYRSEMVLTPFLPDHRIDLARIAKRLEDWLEVAQVQPPLVLGGGALLTGLAARAENAGALVDLVRRRLGHTLVATANDPCLESWLAFMGSCAGLSRAHPEVPILNLDVGGGTTNLALGLAGQVLRTGCLYVGARHVEVEPGSHRIVKLSSHARALFQHLGISRQPGEVLVERERDALLDCYLALLEAAVSGDRSPFATPSGRLHEQVAFLAPPGVAPGAITFSGGVGELIYSHLAGRPWPGTTSFGDLGIDLARRIVASPVLARDLATHRPASAGRATVYGLLRHTTEVSGSTLFLPRPEMLPLVDVPILGRLSPASTLDEVRRLLGLVAAGERGGAILVDLEGQGAPGVRERGQSLAGVLRQGMLPADRPLLLLMRENLGKILGQYATDWGRLPVSVIVVDEVAIRDAQYVQVGAPRDQLVGVSFYGLNE